MRTPLHRFLVVLSLAALSAACGKGEARADPPADQNAQRHMLSEGYSMLYTDASHIDMIKLVLYVKVESEEFNQVITEIAGYGGELKLELERVAREYPGVRIDLQPLPEMEIRKRH